MSIVPSDGEALLLRTVATEVYDVTGAGDTAMAAMAVALASRAAIVRRHAWPTSRPASWSVNTARPPPPRMRSWRDWAVPKRATPPRKQLYPRARAAACDPLAPARTARRIHQRLLRHAAPGSRVAAQRGEARGRPTGGRPELRPLGAPPEGRQSSGAERRRTRPGAELTEGGGRRGDLRGRHAARLDHGARTRRAGQGRGLHGADRGRGRGGAATRRQAGAGGTAAGTQHQETIRRITASSKA